MNYYTYKTGTTDDAEVMARPVVWITLALGVLAFVPLTLVFDTTGSWTPEKLLLPCIGLISIFCVIWALIRSLTGIRIHLTEAGLEVEQWPLKLYRFNTETNLQPLAWGDVQSIRYKELNESGDSQRHFLSIRLHNGSEIRLISSMRSQNPRFIVPANKETPMLRDGFAAFYKEPIINDPLLTEPTPPIGSDLGKRAEWLTFGSLGLFVVAILMMLFSRAHYLDSHMLNMVIGSVGIGCCLTSVMWVRNTPVKAAIPIVAILSGTMAAYFSWSALLIWTITTGDAQKVEFVVAGQGDDAHLESRNHTPVLTMNLVGDSSDRQLLNEFHSTLTVYIGPLGIRAISQSDYQKTLGWTAPVCFKFCPR